VRLFSPIRKTTIHPVRISYNKVKLQRGASQKAASLQRSFPFNEFRHRDVNQDMSYCPSIIT
jgi:hypothetical protein